LLDIAEEIRFADGQFPGESGNFTLWRRVFQVADVVVAALQLFQPAP
jgi:hypothetical protein